MRSDTTDEAALEHIAAGAAMGAMGATFRITTHSPISAQTKREVEKYIMDTWGVVERAEAFGFVEGELTILLLARQLTTPNPWRTNRDKAIELFFSRAMMCIEERFPDVGLFDLVLLDENWMVTL